jgi:hypothetical protein
MMWPPSSNAEQELFARGSGPISTFFDGDHASVNMLKMAAHIYHLASGDHLSLQMQASSIYSRMAGRNENAFSQEP